MDTTTTGDTLRRDDTALATALVTDAARLAARMRDDGLRTEHKSSVADVVTAADRAAEAAVLATLRRERPDDDVVGEEGADVATGAARRWFVDPVDGTFNFVSGLTAWCSAVALEQDGAVLASAVHRPETGETWAAGPDGTTRDGTVVAPLDDAPLAASGVATFLGTGDLRDPATTAVFARVVAAAATVRLSGSGSCDLADVAAGRLGLWLQVDCADWDWLPGRALVEGVGGAWRVVEHGGRRWYLAGRPTAVDEAAELITSAPGAGQSEPGTVTTRFW